MSGTDNELYSEDAEIVQLLSDIGNRQLTRRQILRRGVALGLSIPAINWLLTASVEPASGADADIFDEAATG
jgi:hypothetical protein